MKELETLLNSLVDMGLLIEGGLRCLWVNGNNVHFYNPEVWKTKKITKSLRWLVSLESGLWQFVCENGLCKGDIYERIKGDLQILGAGESYQSDRDYQYRLLESALVPEEELGQFLIENIKTK